MNSRSNFVNGMAWMSILCFGLGTVFSFVQVAAFLIFPMGQVLETIQTQVSGSALWLVQNFKLVALGFLALNGLSLIAAIALLKRREWARKLFLVLLTATIFLHLYGLFSPTGGIGELPGDIPPEIREGVESLAAAGKFLTAVSTAVLLFMLVKLHSRKVRAEFQRLDS